jgi:7-carboxy-7-deazaguanine synthase
MVTGYNKIIKVSGVFKGIQDQCTFAGKPSVIVRLQTCDVGCPFCNAKQTWFASTKDKTDALTNELGKWTPYTADKLVLKIFQTIELEELHNAHVVFTGGEPCMHDLMYVTSMLHQQGFTTQIETSGTKEISCHQDSFVTLSPKIDMPSGKPVLLDAVTRANEILMVVNKQADIDKLLQLIDGVDISGKPVYLTPQSQSLKATDLCIDACASYGFRLALKTNHLIGM